MESRSFDKGVEGYEQIDNGLPVDASFEDRLRESGRLSEAGAVGGLQSVSGQSGSGNRCGDSSGEVRKTEKQQQVKINVAIMATIVTNKYAIVIMQA